MYYSYTQTNELYHYGVKGMKWGVRNDYEPVGRHRSRTPQDKVRKGRIAAAKYTSKPKRRVNKERVKKAAKIGLAVAGTALATYGAYKMYQNGDFDRIAQVGRDALNLQSNSDKLKAEAGFGKSPEQINTKMVKKVNSANKFDAGGYTNCSHTSVSYILNSVMGMNTTAKPFKMYELPGLSSHTGMSPAVFDLIFDGAKITRFNKASGYANSPSVFEASIGINNNSTGIMFLNVGSGGHFLNYEKTESGNMTLVDCQTGKVYKDYTKIPKNWKVISAYDCSNAKLADGAEEYLKHMVKGI